LTFAACGFENRLVSRTEPMRPMEDGPGSSSQNTLRRGLAILEELAKASSARGLDHGSLARRLGLRRSTLYRYLAVLLDAGYIEETREPGRYRLGSRIVYLAAVTHGREFADLSRDAVRELAALTGETAHATVYDYPYSVTIQIENDSSPVGPRLRIGASRPLHACASGKVFLAFERAAVLDAYLIGGLPAMTPRTITDPAELRRVMMRARKDGYAVDAGESYEGVSGLAAPVFDFMNAVVGTLSLTVASDEVTPERLQELADPLVRCSAALSRRLGRVVDVDDRSGE
jgi:DNA-binding IclR family transcriptional regulator